MIDNSIARSNALPDSPDRKEEFWELMRALVLGKADSDLILELFYWSREPAILAMLRGMVAMPEQQRKILGALFTKASPNSISAKVDNAARIILSSTEIVDPQELQ
jgi:hypothetical protein